RLCLYTSLFRSHIGSGLFEFTNQVAHDLGPDEFAGGWWDLARWQDGQIMHTPGLKYIVKTDPVDKDIAETSAPLDTHDIGDPWVAPIGVNQGDLCAGFGQYDGQIGNHMSFSITRNRAGN